MERRSRNPRQGSVLFFLVRVFCRFVPLAPSVVPGGQVAEVVAALAIGDVETVGKAMMQRRRCPMEISCFAFYSAVGFFIVFFFLCCWRRKLLMVVMMCNDCLQVDTVDSREADCENVRV